MKDIIFYLSLAALIISVVSTWKVFVKAGEAGWSVLIPVYNLIVIIRIAGKPLWWVLLLFIPLVNLIASIYVNIEVARNFGKGVPFGIGLWFLPYIFYPILAFGDAQYGDGSVAPEAPGGAPESSFSPTPKKTVAPPIGGEGLDKLTLTLIILSAMLCIGAVMFYIL